MVRGIGRGAPEREKINQEQPEALTIRPFPVSQSLHGGSAIHRMGYVLFQWISEDNPAAGATIVSANSSLLPPNIGFSPIDGEIAALSYS